MPLPTTDLRHDSKAYKRSKNHAAKWSRGGRAAPGRVCSHDPALCGPPCASCISRPRQATPAHFDYRHQRASVHANTHGHRQTHIAKKVLQGDVHDITSTSDSGSSDDDTTREVVNDEFIYSYDARSGPSDGADVLSNAVMQAVKRFENKQTDELVKNEYDLVPDGKGIDEPATYAGDASGEEEDDDFEFISHEQLH